jgi:chemotaxis signal transduction protein
VRIVKAESRKRSHRGEAVILFSVGGTTFAIAAAAVDEIRDLSGMEPLHIGYLHGKFSKFKHTIQREGRTCFVLDAATHFHMLPTKAARLLVLRHMPAGVLVDSIDRMTEISSLHALPRAFTGEERNWYRGLVILKDAVIPLVNPEAFLTKAESTVLTAAVGKVSLAKGAAAV